MAPSPVAKPLLSRFISSKNRMHVSAAVPGGRAACIRWSRSPSAKSSYSCDVRGNRLRFLGSAARGLMTSKRTSTSVGSRNSNVTESARLFINACTSRGMGKVHVFRTRGPHMEQCAYTDYITECDKHVVECYIRGNDVIECGKPNIWCNKMWHSKNGMSHFIL